MNRYKYIILLLLLSALQVHGAPKEYISINTDVYELSVCKNGAININYSNTRPLFSGVQAQILYAGDKRYKRLDVDAESASRFQVNNRLGRGQGINASGRNCALQLHTYPGQSFFSVHLSYKNTGKSPVTVAALSPFHISPPSNGAFNVGAKGQDAQILCFENMKTRMRSLKAESDDVIAIHNQASGQILIAGFLTHQCAETYFQVEQSAGAEQNEFDTFKALCVYDPPVVVLPGEILETEELYISLNDATIARGLERYGAALAAVNGLQPRRNRIDPGLDIGGSPRNSKQLLDAMAWQCEHLAAWDWRHFTIGSGWELMQGDWQPTPERFPDGFTPLVKMARDTGITLGIRLCPFLVSASSPIALQSPEWLLSYEENDFYVLNVARSDVRQWLTRLATMMTQEYGFQSLLLEDTDCLLHVELPQDCKMTRVQFYCQGLRAVREGIGKKHNLVSFPYHPAALPYVDSIGPGKEWDAGWTEVHAMDAALSLQSYLYATGVSPYVGRVYFPDGKDSSPSELSDQHAQSVARLTAIALSGSPIQLASCPEDMPKCDIELLKRFSPTLPHAAYSITPDIMATSAIRHLPLKTPAGEFHIVAFFNWSRFTESQESFNINQFGLSTSTPYTLFEFFSDTYHGLLNGATSLVIPPASVRLFGVRPYSGHPMLLSSDRNISQGALAHRSIEWSNAENKLAGIFAATPGTYCLRFLVPPPWKYKNAFVSAENYDVYKEEEEVVLLRFSAMESQSISWHLLFK